jgi:hypothetical protein
MSVRVAGEQQPPPPTLYIELAIERDLARRPRLGGGQPLYYFCNYNNNNKELY